MGMTKISKITIRINPITNIYHDSENSSYEHPVESDTTTF